jgi:hypothetical protein
MISIKVENLGRLTGSLDHIKMAKLPTSPGFNLTVEQNFTGLDPSLCLTAGFYQNRHLEKLAQPDDPTFYFYFFHDHSCYSAK